MEVRQLARPGVAVVLVALIVIQVVLIYAPDAPGTAPFPHFDKLVHACLFGAPALVAVWGGVWSRALPWLLVIHAPVSEWLQHAVLAHRSGDVWDVLADLVGIGLGVLVGVAGRRRLRW